MIAKLVNSKDIKDILKMNCGPERRNELYKFFCSPCRIRYSDRMYVYPLEGLPIDCLFWPSVRQDPDLKYMLKKGIIKQIRKYEGGWTNVYHGVSYLVLNENKK